MKNQFISGAHMIIYSKNAKADKAFFRDILKLDNVDVGQGWLIFSLPPAEIAVHPSGTEDHHEIYLMCEDINKFILQMAEQNIGCSKISKQGWGQLVQLTLPGGGTLGVYQPRHASPHTAKEKRAVKKAVAQKNIKKKKPASKATGKKNASRKKIN